MLGGLRFRTLEDFSKNLEEVECDWPLEHAEAWADVKANVVVKEVFLATLGNCGAQRLFFRTSEFDGFGSKQFGPPLMELDWFDLVSRLIEISVADEMRGLGEILRKADSGVGRHGIMGHCGQPLPAGKSQSASRTTCLMAYSPTVWVYGKECQSATVQKQRKEAYG